MKRLVIDESMKQLWPAVRVGCFQYKVNVEKKNEDMWKYLKKDIFKKAKNDIFDYGVNDCPNGKVSHNKCSGKDQNRYFSQFQPMIHKVCDQIADI